MLRNLAIQLREAFADLSWQERLIALKSYTDHAVTFSTSFSFEDQAITHVLATENVPSHLFTLDTGRLFEQTHEVFHKTAQRYPNVTLDVYAPEAQNIAELVATQGTNGFYDSKEQRLECCKVRKVEPLARALQNKDIWISGLRREDSEARQHLPIAEYDEVRHIIKLYPLIDVSLEEVRDFINHHNIPYNILHDQGFPSIGCAPCTRSVSKGEDPRAGRWWWERDSAQECGLHLKDGKLVRTQQNA